MADVDRSPRDDATTSDEQRAAAGGRTIAVPADGSVVALSLPADADESEAAAIATAVGAHLRDREATAAAAASDDEGPGDRTDAWTLAGRMKSMGRGRWPDDVGRGEEWRAAARSFY